MPQTSPTTISHACKSHLGYNLCLCLSLFLGSFQANSAHAQEDLPTLGGAGGGIFSSQFEAAIGQQVLRSLRHSAPMLKDPLLLDYLQSLVFRLVPFASLPDSNLTIVIIDDMSINAFAVPGGIIGVNSGLFLYAKQEAEFASVLAHELGHLSQRHFARRVEQQQASTPWTLAGMIAGIVLSAVTRSDAGIATIAGTQAYAAQNFLAYSRQNEQEADRVGIEILAEAGMNPRAMPVMFEQMMRQGRLSGQRPPEYLLTHPLTESRVADTRNRAEQFPKQAFPDSIEYPLMRARILVRYATTPQTALKQFQGFVVSGEFDDNAAAHYGLAVAALAADQPDIAEAALNQLLKQQPQRITYRVTLAETLIAQKKATAAIALLTDALQHSPGNLPITRTLAKAHVQNNQPEAAARLLKQLTISFSEDADLWFDLSEAQGLAGDIVEVHRSRAEYELLMGNLDAAEGQLKQALDKSYPGTPVTEVIKDRLAKLHALRQKDR